MRRTMITLPALAAGPGLGAAADHAALFTDNECIQEYLPEEVDNDGKRQKASFQGGEDDRAATLGWLDTQK